MCLGFVCGVFVCVRFPGVCSCAGYGGVSVLLCGARGGVGVDSEGFMPILGSQGCAPILGL